MARQREQYRKHTAEFKVQAVRLMRERLASGLTLQRVSDELEISPDLLRIWARHVETAPPEASAAQIFPGAGRRRLGPARAPRADPSPPLSAEAEVARLRRENERLRQERDFLKKATAYFAKESR
jgi:transposase-like protein